MSIKNIKEKELLINLSKTFGQDIDPSIVEEVNRQKEFEKSIKDSARNNWIKDLQEALSSIKQDVDEIKEQTNYPVPPSLDELEAFLSETTEEVNDLVSQPQSGESATESVESEQAPETIIERAARAIKVNENSFQQPNPPAPDAQLKSLVQKVRFLEQWLGKVSVHGSGSGETRLKFLDDFNRATIADRDTHKILRYNPDSNAAYDKFFMGFLSGDQGPIYSLKYDTNGYTANANVAAGLTYYDSERDTLEILHKDLNRTYVGQDNYIRVQNDGSTGTIDKGDVLEFSGAETTNLVPLVKKLTATTATAPLYLVGVAANTILPNAVGRATVLGKIEDIDTTGTAVGEVWQAGDLLWAKPNSAGKLTRTKPTSPNVVISVAAVMSTNATTGRLLVRPTIWPRLYSGDFFSTKSQSAAAPDTDTKIELANTLVSSGVVLTDNTITVAESGLYRFDVNCQIASTNSSEKSLVIWYKKSSNNVPFSAVRQSLATNGGYASIRNSQIISMEDTDNVSLHFAVTDTSIFLTSAATLDGAPNVASVQLFVTQPSL